MPQACSGKVHTDVHTYRLGFPSDYLRVDRYIDICHKCMISIEEPRVVKNKKSDKVLYIEQVRSKIEKERLISI
jgi:hypothetical protein